MPDTKSGREKKGLNKESQLESQMARREIRSMDREDEPPRFEDIDEELLADPSELDELDN